jgi:hypothetical protein
VYDHTIFIDEAAPFDFSFARVRDAIVFVGVHENGQVQIQCEMVGGEIGLQVLGVPSAKQCRSG